MSKNLIEKGNFIIKEVNTGSTLGQWMAHYIAELMDKIEKAKGETKTVLSRECAQIIMKLWEMQIRYKGEQVYTDLRNLFHIPFFRDDAHYEKLKNLLENPEEISSSKDWKIFFFINLPLIYFVYF